MSKMTELEQQVEHDTIEAVRALSRQANIMNMNRCVVEAMLDEVLRDHRTIQQNIVRILADFLKRYAEETHRESGELDPNRVDLRNEDAAKFAKKVGDLEPFFRYV